jgi:predicted MFS family arabinose efflux permease
MSHPRTTLLAVTFLESVGTALLQRGLYFYTRERLGFGETENLLTALGYGVVYVAGALKSHALAHSLGEKRLLFATLAGLFALHVVLAAEPSTALLLAGFFAVALLQGLKWPVVESYVSAGLTPAELLPVLGRYNVSWALAMPAAVGMSGLLISSAWSGVLFAIPASINVICLLLLRALPGAPLHLDHAHPERPSQAETERYQALLVSARWSMLGSYGLLFLLAPLLPAIFGRLGVGLEGATFAASLLDGARLLSFMALGSAGAAWRGRALPLALVIVLLPASFAMVLFGSTLFVVLAGEALFGAAAGFAYTAALYYALVVKNASVDAGGAHESLIGLGLGLGPLAGIAGHALTGYWVPLIGRSVGYTEGMIVALSPLITLCVVGALWPIRRR